MSEESQTEKNFPNWDNYSRAKMWKQCPKCGNMIIYRIREIKRHMIFLIRAKLNEKYDLETL